MKKLIPILLLAGLLFSLLTVGGYAYRLSYATATLASGCDMVKSGLLGQDIVFCDADFRQALCVTGYENITICTLPEKDKGILKLAGNGVTEGQVISRENIEKLSFTPASPTVTEAQFTFRCDHLCGGEAIICKLRLIDKINQAPTTSGISDASLRVWTQKNVTVYGSMTASDPENDELTYMVISYPEKGTLTVLDQHFGDFCFTPKKNFKGKDSFTYVVRDSFGNYSSPVSVNIQVSRNVVDITYTDMAEHPAHHAALVMASKGIMQGTIRGDGYYFDPEKAVSKEEFVVMAMKALGVAPKADATVTFFDDDSHISEPMKKYIATAQRYGYIVGEFSEAGLLFSPDEPITRGEAAVIVCRMLGVRTPDTVSVFADGQSIPTYAKNAVQCLYQMGALRRTEGGNISASAQLTRGQTAEMLLQLMESANR